MIRVLGTIFAGLLGLALGGFLERVPEPLARGREHRPSALALPKLRTNPEVVGEHPARKLDIPSRALPELRGVD